MHISFKESLINKHRTTLVCCRLKKKGVRFSFLMVFNLFLMVWLRLRCFRIDLISRSCRAKHEGFLLILCLQNVLSTLYGL